MKERAQPTGAQVESVSGQDITRKQHHGAGVETPPVQSKVASCQGSANKTNPSSSKNHERVNVRENY